MPQANLGTKRQCPKCAAKFYDFGATDPITCPKCSKTWRENVDAKPKKPKKEVAPKPIKVKKPLDDDDAELPGGLPDADDGGIDDIEPMEEEDVEMTSLQEVEEHEEAEEKDGNSDDADDEMFTELADDEKLVDDLEDHIEDEEDEDEEEAKEEDEDDDDRPRRRRR